MSWGIVWPQCGGFGSSIVGFLLAGAAKVETMQEPYTLTSSSGVLTS
jgi:hypothetical protein